MFRRISLIRYPLYYTHNGTSCLNGMNSRYHHGGSDGCGHRGNTEVIEEDEDDASFDMYRDCLEPIFVNLVRISPTNVTQYVQNRAMKFFSTISQMNGGIASIVSAASTGQNVRGCCGSGGDTEIISIEELETVLLMIRLVRSGSNQCTNSEQFIQLIQTIHLSGLNQCLYHRALMLEYFEMTLKYSYVLTAHPNCLSTVLSCKLNFFFFVFYFFIYFFFFFYCYCFFNNPNCPLFFLLSY